MKRSAFLKYISAGTIATIMPMRLVSSGNPSVITFNYPRPVSSLKGAKQISTVTGEILSDNLSVTTMHEHIKLQKDPVERAKSMDFVITDLKRAKELGLRTLVEVGPGADVAGMRDVSLATGINIICCTGFYTLTKDQQSFKVEDFEKQMIRDIEEGIQGTRIRPGVIKVASRGLPVTDGERNAFIAAGHIQKRYSLPICTHAVSGCAEQQQILEQAGADLNHCYFSHVEATFGWSGRKVDQEIDYLEGVVKKDSTLSFNNFGNWNHTKPEDLAHIIRELIKRGYDDHMVATMDVTWTFENGNIKILWSDTNVGGADRNYSYLLRKAVPWMKSNGIPEKSVNKFIVDNPRRIFTW